METILVDIVEAAILALIVVISRYLIPLLYNKLGDEKLDIIKAWAKTFVVAAEQMIVGDKLGDERLTKVLSQLQIKVDETGITLSEDELRSIIEEAVHTEINKEK